MITQRWQQRHSGVMLPCTSKAEAQRLSELLLPGLLTSVQVSVMEDGGQYYVNQSVVYYTYEGAIPYDVPCLRESTE